MPGARLGLVVGLLAAVYIFSPLNGHLWWLGLLVGLLALVCIAPFAVRRATSVAESDAPLRAAAEAILIVAGMVVFGFSSVYLAINRNSTQFEGMSTRLDAIYFTITTVATVGYGDVHPTGQLARALVSLQMLFDLTLLALSVRLLSAAAKERVSGRDSL